jgi:dipeptidyl aminopeptidase/acylaminoacyl peptidase
MTVTWEFILRRFLLLFLFAFFLVACLPQVSTVETSTPASTTTPFFTATSFPTDTATVSPTPNPYYKLGIDYLRSRTYGGGAIEFLDVMGQNFYFTRYLIRYPSDGVNIYGFADIPNDVQVHPVIIALHGYIDPAIYQTLDYTTRYADALAIAGYVVLHPNLRGYQPSDNGENLFRVGMAIDVLNLIALAQSQAGVTDQLRNANPNLIGVWGHSMGGGIATRVLTVSDDVKAAVLYAAMSGDEEKNYNAIREWSGQTRGLEELNIPVDAINEISPMYFFENITAPISIHHGKADALVPIDWSITTCEQLQSLGKDVECQYYDDMPHTFSGKGDEQFIQNMIDFFNQKLK